MVGSSATSLARAPASLSSSDLLAAVIATGNKASGNIHGSTSTGSSGSLNVSVVSALVSLATTHRSPAMAIALGRNRSPRGEDNSPTRSSASWLTCPSSRSPPAKRARCPETCTTESGRRVPLNIRTILTRPTYGSLVVRITSATRGPCGSHSRGGRGSPPGVVAAGSGCSVGAGKAAVSRWSSSRVPTPVSVETGGEEGKVVGVSNTTDFYRACSAGNLTSSARPLHRGRSQQVWLVETIDDRGRTVSRGQVRLQNLRA